MPEVKKVSVVSSRLYKTPALPPEVLEKKKNRKALESNRYDVSKYEYPDTHWEFYDTFLKCDITASGIAKGEPTTADLDDDDGKTERYIRKTVAARKEAMAPVMEPPEEPPEPFRTLLFIVDADGRWKNLKLVKKVLRLPRHARISETTSEWEAATALALAAIRQQFEYFHLLGDVFDKANTWLTNMPVMYEAKRVLSEYQDAEELEGYESPSADVTSEGEEAGDEDSAQGSSATDKSKPSSHDTLTMGMEGMNGVGLETNTPKEGGAADTLGNLTLDVNAHPASPTGQSAPQTPSLAERMRAITPQVDQRRKSKAEARIADLMQDIFRMSNDLDKHRTHIEELASSSVAAFNACETHTERTYVFLELTATIADGQEKRRGLPPEDWRSRGAVGYRPKVLALLAKIQDLADARLDLEEIDLPGGRSADAATAYVPDGNRGRWGMVWDGNDLVAKILHSLDFLRDYKEFRQWYGRTYFFLCNPLCLPFDLSSQSSVLGMDEKVKEHLDTFPHFRHVKYTEHDWQHQKYLWKWKEKFVELSSGRWDWWPPMPVLREEKDQQKVYVAALTLLIKCHEEMTKFSKYERELVSYESTARGQGGGSKSDIRDLVFFMPQKKTKEEEEDPLDEEYDLGGESADGMADDLPPAPQKKPVRRGTVQVDTHRRASVNKLAANAHSRITQEMSKDRFQMSKHAKVLASQGEPVTEDQVLTGEGGERGARLRAEAAERGPSVRLRKASTMSVSTANLRLMGKNDKPKDPRAANKGPRRGKTASVLGALATAPVPALPESAVQEGDEESVVSKASSHSTASTFTRNQNALEKVKQEAEEKVERDMQEQLQLQQEEAAEKVEAGEKAGQEKTKKGKNGSRRRSTMATVKGSKSQHSELTKNKEKFTNAVKESTAVTRAQPEKRRLTKRAATVKEIK